jgi:nitrate reductase cytochrome c-type subunit
MIGLLLSILLIAIFFLPQTQKWQKPGAMNTGHENLSCLECHESASGTVRQQIQSNVAHWLDDSKEASSFIYTTPDNKDCIACHEREDDNHPIYRFNEPKFSKVRKILHPEHCVSCHKEHQGVRVTSEPTNCKNCHKELKIKNDSLETSHAKLIEQKNWESCLACHDFHGNHKRETPKKKIDMISQKTLKSYFEGGKNPYGKDKIAEAKESRYED